MPVSTITIDHEAGPRQIRAIVRGHLALAPNRTGWCVTHVGTGMLLVQTRRCRSAREALRYFTKLGKWEFAWDIGTPKATQHAILLRQGNGWLRSVIAIRNAFQGR